MVDPIDGTVNFVYGIPAYAVSVAAVRGVSLAGAVVDVANAATYGAGGAGATRTDPAGSRPGCAATMSPPWHWPWWPPDSVTARRGASAGAVIARLLPRVRDIRRIGSAALDLCMVAAGRVDAHFEHGLNPWDWAAGALIAAEAGAVVRFPGPIRGEPTVS